MRLITRRGQSTAEYAVLIAVAVGAIVAMQIYVKRGIQGKVKGAMDHFTSQGTAETGTIAQYEPYTASSDYNVVQGRSAVETMAVGGSVARTGISETTTRTGSSRTEVDRTQDTNWTPAGP